MLERFACYACLCSIGSQPEKSELDDCPARTDGCLRRGRAPATQIENSSFPPTSVVAMPIDWPIVLRRVLPQRPLSETISDLRVTAAGCRGCAERGHSPSLDQLVGLREQQWRHGEAERFGGLKVDDQLEFGRLLHRQIGRFGALEDAIDIGG
jgi:hypothetical protein